MWHPSDVNIMAGCFHFLKTHSVPHLLGEENAFHQQGHGTDSEKGKSHHHLFEREKMQIYGASELWRGLLLAFFSLGLLVHGGWLLCHNGG